MEILFFRFHIPVRVCKLSIPRRDDISPYPGALRPVAGQCILTWKCSVPKRDDAFLSGNALSHNGTMLPHPEMLCPFMGWCFLVW